MKNLFSKLKRRIRLKTTHNPNSQKKELSYKEKTQIELDFYKNCHNVHELPDIYHYWSNKFLLPKYTPFGFSNPDDFFVFYCKEYCLKNSKQKQIKILSIGSGNGELEVKIATELVKEKATNFSISCMDINKDMLNRTMDLAKEQNVGEFVKLKEGDFNKWQPSKECDYDLIIANQSLHHVLELEHLFDSIHKGMKNDGLFLTSDMIGRNGHMRWGEALKALQPFWQELPEKYKYNQLLKRQEKNYINHDCSTQGFEGIRAQDILKLLVERFSFELFVPFANIITVFIDRPFGHNFDINNPSDLNFIDRVHAVDDELILNGTLKPTQMLAVMAKGKPLKPTKLVDSILTPEYCIRHF